MTEPQLNQVIYRGKCTERFDEEEQLTVFFNIFTKITNSTTEYKYTVAGLLSLRMGRR